MKRPSLLSKLDSYLRLREALGTPIQSQLILQQFAEYLDRQDRTEPIRTNVVIDWVCNTPQAHGISAQHARFFLARGFLIYLKASFPETEIPDSNLIAKPRRPTPYVFSTAELVRLLIAAGSLGHRSILYAQGLQVLLGLMAFSGLRPEEANKLMISDIHLDETPPSLLIRSTKFHKTRWVPIHVSTAGHLRRYLQWRTHIKGAGLSDRLFITKQVQPIRRQLLQRTFQTIVRRLEIYPRMGQLRPTLHSLRHTFAVHRLRRWYEEGANVQALLPSLSIYLGHSDPAASYWYLTATPELMDAASHRFESYAETRGVV